MSPGPSPSRPRWLRFDDPAYLTWLAILVGWIGIWLAYRGKPLGAALAGLAKLIAVLAYFGAGTWRASSASGSGTPWRPPEPATGNWPAAADGR